MRFSSILTLAVALPIVHAVAVPLSARTNYDDHKKADEKLDWTDKHDDGKTHKHVSKPLSDDVFDFTSTYIAYATPDQVVNNSQVAVPGEEGASGVFRYGINVHEELICWNIAVEISGDYQSPASTATHIHEAVYGRAGPPRIAFTNPSSDSPLDEFGRRTSYGCLTGPFLTGVLANGTDTGTGFSLAQIEANPAGFFTDVHTTKFVAGAIRGQLELASTTYHH